MSFIFGLIVGAAGAVAVLKYKDKLAGLLINVKLPF